MLTKRIIPCLDVRDGNVVKGIKFKNHRIIGDPINLAKNYSDQNADELVFYDIGASTKSNTVKSQWVLEISKKIDIPFCVAGGIKTIKDAENILSQGADKISINTPALENPNLINEFAKRFGSQCVVIGIDSLFDNNIYSVYAKTGSEKSIYATKINTIDWIKEVQDRGAGEIVLNCMNEDGVKNGYDLEQLAFALEACHVPLIASGGAGQISHFKDVFDIGVDGALAASVFHDNKILINDLKKYLSNKKIQVRI